MHVSITVQENDQKWINQLKRYRSSKSVTLFTPVNGSELAKRKMGKLSYHK